MAETSADAADEKKTEEDKGEGKKRERASDGHKHDKTNGGCVVLHRCLTNGYLLMDCDVM